MEGQHPQQEPEKAELPLSFLSPFPVLLFFDFLVNSLPTPASSYSLFFAESPQRTRSLRLSARRAVGRLSLKGRLRGGNDFHFVLAAGALWGKDV